MSLTIIGPPISRFVNINIIYSNTKRLNDTVLKQMITTQISLGCVNRAGLSFVVDDYNPFDATHLLTAIMLAQLLVPFRTRQHQQTNITRLN